MTIYMVVGTLGSVGLLTLIITSYHKRWKIRYVIFAMKARLTAALQRQHEPIEHYEYDAFISYSNADEDRTWVHFTLVPELEQKYGFKLCIHHRDFIGGWDIADNIKDAIVKSRKVIAIMSPDFIKSKWCSREIQMTDTVDSHKLIFVMYKDISLVMDSISPHISMLLDERTYIEYGHEPNAMKLFWKKIVKAIYRPDVSRPGLNERTPLL